MSRGHSIVCGYACLRQVIQQAKNVSRTLCTYLRMANSNEIPALVAVKPLLSLSQRLIL